MCIITGQCIAISNPCQRVAINRPLSIQYCVAGNNIVLEVPCIIASFLFEPATEGVTGFAQISRFRYLAAVSNSLVCSVTTVTLLIEAYRIGIGRLAELSYVVLILCCYSILINSRIPTGKRVCELSRSSLGRICSSLPRNRSLITQGLILLFYTIHQEANNISLTSIVYRYFRCSIGLDCLLFNRQYRIKARIVKCNSCCQTICLSGLIVNRKLLSIFIIVNILLHMVNNILNFSRSKSCNYASWCCIINSNRTRVGCITIAPAGKCITGIGVCGDSYALVVVECRLVWTNRYTTCLVITAGEGQVISLDIPLSGVCQVVIRHGCSRSYDSGTIMPACESITCAGYVLRSSNRRTELHLVTAGVRTDRCSTVSIPRERVLVTRIIIGDNLIPSTVNCYSLSSRSGETGVTLHCRSIGLSHCSLQRLTIGFYFCEVIIINILLEVLNYILNVCSR